MNYCQRISTLLVASIFSGHALAQLKTAPETCKWGVMCIDFTAAGLTGDTIGAGNMLPDQKFSAANMMGSKTTDGFNARGTVTDLSAEKKQALAKIGAAAAGNTYFLTTVSAHAGRTSDGGYAFDLPKEVMPFGSKHVMRNGVAVVENVAEPDKKFSRLFSFSAPPGSQSHVAVKGPDGKPMNATNADQRPMNATDTRYRDLMSQRITASELMGVAKQKNIQGVVCMVDGCFAGGMKEAIQKDPKLKDMPMILIGGASATELAHGGTPALRDKSGKVTVPAQGFLSGYTDEVSHNIKKFDKNGDGSVDLGEFVDGLPKSITPMEYDPKSKQLRPYRSADGKKPYDSTQHPWSYTQGDPEKISEMRGLKMFTQGTEITELQSESGTFDDAKTVTGHSK